MIREIRDRLNGRISWRQTFTALRYPNYKLWFWGQMTSLFGTWMQMTALGYLMFELTRSPAFLGYVGFASGAPTWLFMLYAGVVADRMSRRKLMIITQTGMMVLAFILAGMTFFHIIRPWHIIALAFLGGVGNAFDAPARQSIVQELVAYEDMTNAIALNSAMFNAATAVGPAIAGVTYALLGPGWCFTINGVSFIAIIAALAAMKLVREEKREGDSEQERERERENEGEKEEGRKGEIEERREVRQKKKNSVMGDLKEGLCYVASEPLIRTIISLVAVISLFGFAFSTLIPAWAVNMLKGDATTNGLMQSARGFGAMASALMIASLGRFKFRGKLLTIGSFAFPALLFVFSFIRSVPVTLVALFCVGFALILVFNLANASIQTLTPDWLRGRVMSVYSFTFFGFMPIGALFIGWVAERFSEPSAVVINAVITLAYAGILAIFVPKLRRLQ